MKYLPQLFIDRLLSGKFLKQLLIVVGLFIGLLILVTIIYTGIVKGNEDSSFGENITKAFVDLTNPETLHNSVYNDTKYGEEGSTDNDSQINIPQWVLILAYIFGAIVFTGLLIATITNAWRGRADRFRRGAVSYWFKDHTVFLGYNHLIAGMILKILEKNKNARIVVGVENNASVICDKIKNRLYKRHRNNVVVLQADSCNREDLERLRVCRAKEVFIIGEHDDTYNLKCYRTIYELYLSETGNKAKMPQCYVNLHSQATLTLFRTYASSGELGIDFTKFHSFSFYDEWARMMIINKWNNYELMQNHFFIVGMTEMGVALALQTALMCHNPNEDNRTTITIIDEEVEKLSKQFMIQYQNFFEHCYYRICSKNVRQTHFPKNKKIIVDVEFEFLEGNLTDASIRHLISNNVGFQQQITTIAICYDDPQQNLTMGLNLPDVVYECKLNAFVWVYQPTFGDLGNYLRNSRYKNVITFGMSGEDLDIKNEENTYRAKLINHYFRNQNKENIEYSNQLLMEQEWNRVDINERWSCVRRADFITILARYNTISESSKEKNTKMYKIAVKRSLVDGLLFDLIDRDSDWDLYKYENDEVKYIEALKHDIIPNDFTVYII